MRTAIALHVCFIVAIAMGGQSALAANDPEAIEELKTGYALKQAGDCRGAIAHLARSFQLDAKPKALLNLSDCEQRIGDLVAAQGHAAAGRSLARQENEAELVRVADEQLTEIETRLPQLTITLAQGTPQDCEVFRDGARIEPASLLVPVGVNPGTHTIAVRAPGYGERRVEVNLEEGARRQIEVAPGDPLVTAVPSARPGPPVAPALQRSARSMPDARRPWPASKIVAIALAGAGVISVGIGSFYGLDAIAKKNEALQKGCNSHFLCRAGDGLQLAQDGYSKARVADIAFGIGAASLLGAVVLWVMHTSDTPAPSGATWSPRLPGGRELQLGVAAWAGREGQGMAVRGIW
jgi:serine/threonine-protein kinase